MSAPARALVPIETVVDGLTMRVAALAEQLLPGGQRSRHEWVCSGNTFGTGTSMAVHLVGPKAGVWKNFIDDARGDALDLVAYMLFAGDKKRAFAWARQWLGLETADPALLEAVRRQATERQARAEQDEAATQAAAFRLWLGGQKQLAGTPVEYYLAGRGIDLAELGRQPGAIRFHPRVRCTEAERDLPAMVTAICDGAGKFVACHRTWLEQAGAGDWRKARLIHPKKTLGRFAGGMIRLWRGASGKAMSEALPGETVDITEGIEDALSVVMATPAARVVAAISLSNMSNLTFPPAITAVRLWRQNDTAPAAINTFDRAVQGFMARGLKVIVPKVPEGFKDVNDWINAVCASTDA